MEKPSHNRIVRVCILRSNPVRPDSRVEKEAWTLKEAGYDVHILAWDRDTNVRVTNEFVSVADVQIPITRLGYKATYGEGLKNIRAYLAFQFHMRRWLKRNHFDVVHACDFDTAFFSRGVVKRKKAKFVFDVFDFLCGEPKSILQRVVKKAQLRIINHADATIICTEERRKQIAGSHPKRLTVIHNTPAAAQYEQRAFEVESTGKIKIVYVGILQDLRLLKEIASAVSESPEMEFHVGGFGKYEAFFSNMADKFDNIYFYGRLAYKDTLALEGACDVMLAVYDPLIENHRFAAPNKFYESLMLGKPVVMVKNTGMSHVVEENDIGVLIDYSKEGFIDGVNQLIGKKESWPSMGEKMKDLYCNQYCWSEMERRLVALYAELCDEKNTNSEQ